MESNINVYMKFVKFILYVVIFFVSVIGNILVCVVIFKKRRMKIVINYFILNLVFVDLIFILICILFDIFV